MTIIRSVHCTKQLPEDLSGNIDFKFKFQNNIDVYSV